MFPVTCPVAFPILILGVQGMSETEQDALTPDDGGGAGRERGNSQKANRVGRFHGLQE